MSAPLAGRLPMNTDRLIELETKMSYQEETLHVLNEVVARQQKQIEKLELALRQLAERVIRAGEQGDKNTAAEELPPHY
jgi:SlyX protein